MGPVAPRTPAGGRPWRSAGPALIFADRSDAGRRLAAALRGREAARPAVVLGLPRGGVPVAYEVARSLGAPLDVIVVRKLGVPFQPELAMGAIGEGGVRIVNETVVRSAGVTEEEFAAVEARERAELARRADRYRMGSPPTPLDGRVAIVVDDGLATGSTARAACTAARSRGAARVVLAVPVAPVGWARRIGPVADECVSVETPEPFFAIGEFYEKFSQVPDAEVADLLRRAPGETGERPAGGGSGPVTDEEVSVPVSGVRLPGRLTVPPEARGVVVFAHGSGSSRLSPRNIYVAEVLHGAGLGTLLFDLLTSEEEADRANVFDVELLGRRLAAATAWVRDRRDVHELPVGYFGASTGAAAALWAAAEPGADIAAIVSRGGRPDLAGRRLGDVAAPTLLIVGGWDDAVLALNRDAREELRCEAHLSVVPGATHLFEEPGTLEQAAELARDWFLAHVGRAGGAAGTGKGAR